MAILPVLTFGCTHYDVSEAIRVSAFRPDGTNPTGKLTEFDARELKKHGTIIEFHENDVLEVKLGVGGDVLESVERTSVKVRVKHGRDVDAGDPRRFRQKCLALGAAAGIALHQEKQVQELEKNVFRLAQQEQVEEIRQRLGVRQA